MSLTWVLVHTWIGRKGTPCNMLSHLSCQELTLGCGFHHQMADYSSLLSFRDSIQRSICNHKDIYCFYVVYIINIKWWPYIYVVSSVCNILTARNTVIFKAQRKLCWFYNIILAHRWFRSFWSFWLKILMFLNPSPLNRFIDFYIIDCVKCFTPKL